MISTAFRIQIVKVYGLSCAYKKKEMRFEFIMLSWKKLVKMFLEKLVLGIDLAMAEEKSVIKNFLTKKNYSAIAFQNFIENSDWRHFYGAVTGDMMLLEFQRIIERALALHAPIKACYIRTDKPKFLLQEKWLCEETKRQFSRISEDETKTI